VGGQFDPVMKLDYYVSLPLGLQLRLDKDKCHESPFSL